MGGPTLRKPARLARPFLYTLPRSVELLDLAALHEAPTLPLLWKIHFYGEAGESRA
jgi:hypothetical protein